MIDEFTYQTRYRIIIQNQGNTVITPCLYWSVPAGSSLSSVSWYWDAAAPTTRLLCELDYVPGFFCAPAAPAPGTRLAQPQPLASPLGYAFNNSITASFVKGKYLLGTPRPYGERDTLYLFEDPSIPEGTGSAGFTVAGNAALVAATNPSTTLSVPMSLQLNVVLADAPAGTILTPSQLTTASAIALPQNIVTMYVTYDKNGDATISQYPPSQPANAEVA